MKRAPAHKQPRWELPVGIFVAVGSLATIALAFIESWWG
jgi:hypothetical protein